MLNTCTDLKQIEATSHNKSAVRKEGNSEDVMPGFGYGDTLLGNRLLGLQGNARPRPRPSAIPLALALYLSRVGSDLKTSEEK